MTHIVYWFDEIWIAAVTRHLGATQLQAFIMSLANYPSNQYWTLLPSWYHLLFLVLIVPATLFGGYLCAR